MAPAGPLPQWMRLMANFPIAGKRAVASFRATEEQGDLSPLLKAQISWVIARQDRAWYALGDARRRLLALGQSDSQIEALDGDQQARAAGQASLRRVMALMSAAGGRQLLERWDDRALTDLNLDISNAVTKYQAFYMIRMLDDSSQFAKESRAAAAAEFAGATRRYDEAKRLFRRIS